MLTSQLVQPTIDMNSIAAANFFFQEGELPEKLSQQQAGTGEWRFQLTSRYQSDVKTCYLSLVQGRVVFAGNEHLSRKALLRALQRYLLALRKPQAQAKILDLVKESTPEQRKRLGMMLTQLEQAGVLKYHEIIPALRQKILADFDAYLFHSSGQAEFFSEPDLIVDAQIPSFNLEDLLIASRQRYREWQDLVAEIPSLQSIPKLNREALARSNLGAAQVQQIEKLLSQGNTLGEIANRLAKDSLEIAKVFAKLTRNGLISLVQLESSDNRQTPTSAPEIFVVDDSPVLIEQFHGLVTSWGYQVTSCLNALRAVDEMLQSSPNVIFLDINMPGASGFDLIKQIRRQPQLTSIPLVILTGEKSVSNQWRAQWAKCKFLTKPSTRQELPGFRENLRQLLQEYAPLQQNYLLLNS